MINLLRGIVDFISSCAQFIINIFTSLLSFVAHIPQFSTFVINALNVLPNIVLPFALASVSISIVLFLINRKVG